MLQLEGHENKFLIHFISFICLVKPVLQLSDILPHLCNARLNCYNRAGKTAEVKTIQNFRTGPKRHFSSHFLFWQGRDASFGVCRNTFIYISDGKLLWLRKPIPPWPFRCHNNLRCFWFAKCFILKICLVKWAAQANEGGRGGTLEQAAERTVNILSSHITSGQTDLSFSFQGNWIGWDHA